MLRANTPGQDVAAIVSDVERCAVLRRWPIGALFKAAEKLQSDGDPATAGSALQELDRLQFRRSAAARRLFQLQRRPGQGGRSIRRDQRCQGVHSPQAGFPRALHQSWRPLGRDRPTWGGRRAVADPDHEPGAGDRRPPSETSWRPTRQLGRVLENHQQDGVAEETLKQSLELSAAQPEVIQHWIALRQRQCKWPVVEGWDHAPSATLTAGRLAVVAGEPRRRPDVPARKSMEVQSGDDQAGRQPASYPDAFACDAPAVGEAQDRLRLFRSSRACGRLRDDRRP